MPWGKERRLAILQGHADPSKTGIPAGPQQAWAGLMKVQTNTDHWRTTLALKGTSLCMMPCLLLTTHTHTHTHTTHHTHHTHHTHSHTTHHTSTHHHTQHTPHTHTTHHTPHTHTHTTRTHTHTHTHTPTPPPLTHTTPPHPPHTHRHTHTHTHPSHHHHTHHTHTPTHTTHARTTHTHTHTHFSHVFLFLFLVLKRGNKLSCLLCWRTLLINIWLVCRGVKPKMKMQNQNKLSRMCSRNTCAMTRPLAYCVSPLVYINAFMLSYMSYSLSYVAGGGLRLNLNLWLKQCAPLETAHYFIFPEARGTLASPRLLRVQHIQIGNDGTKP